MSNTSKCKCLKPDLSFKRYEFANDRISYKGTCLICGLVRCWMNGKNYRLLSDNSPRGGDKKTG